MLKRFIVAALAVALTSTAPAFASPPMPTVAVYGFDMTGISPWWGSAFNPGDALADLLSDRLVNAGTVSVIDRDHLQQVLQEQNLAKAGDVTPASEAKLGRMLGVGYLFVGKIVQFDKSSNGGGGFGRLAGLGGAASTKTTLHVSMKVLEANTGRVVAAVEDEETNTATSYAIGAVGNGSAAAYKSPDFQNSAMGRLLTSVADDLAKKVDTSKLIATAPAPVIEGKIIGADGGNYILNVGSDSGVETGMVFNALDIKVLIDPDSKKTITSKIPKGTIQIISVSKDSSIAKSISGSISVRQAVRSE